MLVRLYRLQNMAHEKEAVLPILHIKMQHCFHLIFLLLYLVQSTLFSDLASAEMIRSVLQMHLAQRRMWL